MDNRVSRGFIAPRIRRIAIAVVCAAAIGTAPAAFAADDAEMAKDAGIGLGSAFASLVYAPAKTFYALGGVLVGGLAWAFSGGDAEVARTVLTPSVLGDYVITPAHLMGAQPVEFFGRRQVDQPAQPGYDQYQGYSQQQSYDAPAEVATAPDGW